MPNFNYGLFKSVDRFHAVAMQWVIDGELLRSHRPGYPSERVPEDVVAKWVEGLQWRGIASVLCLLSPTQVRFYQLPEGQSLVDYYRQAGLEVAWVRVADWQSPALSEAEMAQALEAYDALPKPCLVHCSAGAYRTGAVVEAILARLP